MKGKIYPVLHPVGENEVPLNKDTRHLYSFYSDYTPISVRKGYTVDDCPCKGCKRVRENKKNGEL